jgi:parvulin-like peptidyl-prolyl isomerase
MALLVNGDPIDDAALREERKAIRRLLAEQMPGAPAAEIEEKSREWARENLIERVLLRQAASKDTAPMPAEAIDREVHALQLKGGNALREDVEQRLRIERFIATLTAHVATPRRKDVVEYYKKNRASFHAPEAVHAAHIVKNIDERTDESAARSAIEDIHRALHEGAEFESLADERSDCPGRGGDLGYFGRGEMVDEFERVAFALSPGEISDIFRTPFGFHIVKIYDRRPEGILPLEAVIAAIEERLLAQKKQKVLEQHLDVLRARAKVEEASPVR